MRGRETLLGNWTPAVGKETSEYLEHLKIDRPNRDRLSSSARQILSHCVSPNMSNGSTTGLVVGHIQSGKTRSFTTVITLARDNGYRMIVVITGMSKTLNRQSADRIRSDLRLETPRDRKWLHFNNPRVDSDYRKIRATLANWNDANVGADRAKTVLITVMKNHTHLQHLTEVMQKLSLENVPCLVIDDEGDQASLNTLV